MPKTRPHTPRTEKVDALLDAAEQLFAERGFDRTSTSRLAKAAGVSERTLYWYFPTKDHVLCAVVRRASDRLVGELRSSGWPDAADPAGSMFALLQAMRSMRHLIPAFHQRAEVSEHVAATRDSFRAANDRTLSATFRSAGVPEAQLEPSINILLAFADGVLLRNIEGAELERAVRELVSRLLPEDP
jgi:TetR/AcrR family transcriptional regulator, cholesterol catabolism regulator